MHIYICIYIYIYIYIYGNHKTLIPIMVAHVTNTTIYIIVIEVSGMHLLLCAIYQTQKGVWLVCFIFLNKFQYQTYIPNKPIEQNAFLTLYAPVSQNVQTNSNNLSANCQRIV